MSEHLHAKQRRESATPSRRNATENDTVQFAQEFIEQPDLVTLGTDHTQVARTLMFMLASIGMTMFGFFLFSVTAREVSIAAYLLVPLVAIGGVLALRRGHVLPVVHAFILGCLIAIDGFTLVTGGPHSASQIWIAALPFMITALLPARFARPWCMLILLNQVGLLICFSQGLYNSSLLVGDRPTLVEFMPDFLLAPLVVGAFAAWAARNSDHILDRIRRASSVLRLVVDEMNEQILIIDRHGKLTHTPRGWATPIAENAKTGDSLIAILREQHGVRGESFAVGFDAVAEQTLPMALLLEQMPSEWTVNGRDLHITYHPIWDGHGGPWSRLALAISDVTEERERQRAEQQRDETVRIFRLLQTERDSLVDFVQESERLVERIRQGRSGQEWLRSLHTLKGSAGVLSLLHLSDTCHRAEQFAAVGALEQARQMVLLAWADWRALFDQLTDSQALDRVTIDAEAFEHFQRLLDAGASYAELHNEASLWTYLPVRRELERLAARAPQIASRLGKPEPLLIIDAEDIRVDKKRWQPLWAALIHLIRNAVDHGLESADRRAQAGKTARGALTLRAHLIEDALCIEVGDDGAGIQWAAVRRNAERLGLASGDTMQERVNWLLTDGLSTRATVNDVSGRGLGLAAVAEAVEDLGGTLDVRSTRHQGTWWTLQFPASSMHSKASRHPTPSDVNRAMAAAS